MLTQMKKHIPGTNWRENDEKEKRIPLARDCVVPYYPYFVDGRMVYV